MRNKGDRFFLNYIGIGGRVKIKDNLYFFEAPGNTVYKMNMSDGIKDMCKVSLKANEERLAYYACAEVEEKAYFIPYYASDILIFDIKQKIINKIPCDYQHITNAISIDENIFFWGNKSEKIARYNIKTKQFYEINFAQGLYINAADNRNYVVIDDVAYIPISGNGCLLEINLKNESYHIINTGIDTEIFTISYDGELFWLTGITKKLYGWNRSERDFFEIKLDEININHNLNSSQLFYSCICLDEYIYLSPFSAAEFIRIEKKSKKIEVLKEISDEEIGGLIDDVKGVYLYCENIREGTKREYIYFTADGKKVDSPIDFCGRTKRIKINENKRDNIRQLLNVLKD